MKAELILDQTGINPEYNKQEALKCAEAEKPYPIPRTIPLPKGTIIEGPKAYRLVEMGSAVPADEECVQACGKLKMTSEAVAERLEKYKKVEEGRSTGIKAYDAEPKKATSEVESE